MKYFIIAGEASGDLHASHVVSEIKHIDSTAEVKGMGGPKMSASGVNLVVDYSDYSFMGFVEVIANLGKIKKLFSTIKSNIDAFNPDKVILVDYGGFNLKIAKYCKEKCIETHFYILPKVWAWNEKRVKKIKRFVDVGYCIFPFEQDYFRKHGVNAYYVGNPVVEQILDYLKDQSDTSRQDYIALLPGSRQQEIKRILPTLLDFANSRQDLAFKIAAHNPKPFASFTFPDNVQLSEENTYATVLHAKAAIVTSGTANLETALLNTPQVVCYKANRISFFLGKLLVKIKYISPVNLILDNLVIRELIQGTFNVVHLEEEVNKLLHETTSEEIRQSYKTLWTVLGKQSAAKKTATKITSTLMKTKNILFLVPVLAILIGCKGKSKVNADDKNARTISIEYNEQYCGGAEPTDEMMEEIDKQKPLVNQTVYISRYEKGRMFTDEIKVNTDKAGYATVVLDTGVYVVSFYKLNIPAPVVEDKAEPDNTQDVPNDQEEVVDEEAYKAECERQWKQMTATPFKIIGGKSAYKVIMNKECNPCEEPRP